MDCPCSSRRTAYPAPTKSIGTARCMTWSELIFWRAIWKTLRGHSGRCRRARVLPLEPAGQLRVAQRIQRAFWSGVRRLRFRAAHPERQCLLVWRSCGDQRRVHLTCKIKGRQFLQYRTNIAAISKIRLTHPANSFIIALLPESAATNSHIKREAFRYGTTTNHFIGMRKRRPPPASTLPDGPAPLLSTSAGTSGPPCSAGGDGRRRGR